MLGSANGQIAFMMNGGSVSQLAVRLANLDVANSVVLLLGGDKSMAVRCMVVDLDAKDGNMEVKTMVLDTAKSIINGRGQINFKDETLDLRLASDAKGLSLAALRGPIDVTGTFKNPKAGPSLKNVSGRAATAVALGVVSWPLAFIPLLDFGGAEDSDCAALLKDATAHGKEEPKK
jgi:AsmA family protein